MAEPLSLGASVLAFIGLAGQVLQGCDYICDFVNSVQEASGDITNLQVELRSFKVAVLGFQTLLRQFEPSWSLDVAAEQIGMALNASSLAISELKALIEKYEGDGHRDWWRGVKIARKRAKFVKCVDRLGRAKTDIAMAQSSAILILGVSQKADTHQLSHDILSMNATSTIRDSATMRNVVTEIQSISREATRMIALSMDNNLLEQMEGPKNSMEVMVRNTVNNALRSFFQEATKANKVNMPLSSKHISWTSSTGNMSQILEKRSQFLQLRKQIRQKCHRFTVYLWFAAIAISCTTTIPQTPLHSSEKKTRLLRYVRITVDIRPNPWISQKGILAVLERHYSASIFLNSDLRLRVYNAVLDDAPIIKACRECDISTAYALFATGQATPHGVSKTRGGLLDVVWNTFISHIHQANRPWYTNKKGKIHGCLQGLKRSFQMYQFLVDNGLDPCEQRNLSDSPLRYLIELAYNSHPCVIPHIIDMVRFFVSKISINPLELGTRYKQAFFQAALDCLPEIVASIEGLDVWDMPIPQDRTSSESEAGFFGLYDTIYSLFRDPEANYLRKMLPWHEDIKEACGWMFHTSSLVVFQSNGLSQDKLKCVDSALKARMVAFLEAGMDPGCLTKLPILHVEQESMAQIFIMGGRAEMLRYSLLEVGWDWERISALNEDGATAWLSTKLDFLKPWRPMFWVGEKRRLSIDSETKFDYEQRLYENKRATSLCDGYRQYFPDDEEEIRQVCDRYDRFFSIYDYMPAINGLTEDFWD